MKPQNSLLLLLTTVFAEPEPEKRDVTTTTTTASGFNFAAFSNALVSIANGTTANFANISPAPKLLVPEVMSVVPLTVFMDLFDASSRSSMASQFSNGSTPAWYSSLPADVKQYVAVVRAQISDGALTATQAASTAGATATATGTASAGSISSSSAMAAQPTVVTASMISALGILGLALVL
ncbi:uncharacterized protein N7483_002256 [Penicillium malachiteum]|uniref:uncharacterized protein n=1 Tax=Penicillium malachiteum TaxID=1324776 RepID=UPI002548AB4C|nr:uncharacterized protein N7483_002256 [Penicillium malachiteum]KAJ5737131.1 hypothetical protein N7483_002256 [Penicillium malachiteum]